ncbi:NADH:flavin oxidoreductase [soil metagenome]
MSANLLFKPFTVKNLTLPNRIVMAPMTRNKSPKHVPTQEVADYYRRRAEGGVGLIITEGTVINHKAGHAYPDVPNIFGEEALKGWEEVVKQVHTAGGLIFPQLWHVGSVRQRKKHQNPGVDNPMHCCHCNHSEIPGYGPSAVAHPYVSNAEIPQTLSQQDIDEIIHAFAKAAKDAKEIGFDGIELHGAHGYLIDQFFWDFTNKRTDKYGGKTLAARTQFAVEVIAAVRHAVGDDYPISFRMSQWKLGDYDAKMAHTPIELEDFLRPLTNAGVDIFHCSTRRFFEPEFQNSNLNLAGWVKKLTGKPTITVGSVGLDKDFMSTHLGETAKISESSIDRLLSSLESQEFDLVAVGRMLLSNPDWSQKINQGKFSKIVPFAPEHLNKLY